MILESMKFVLLKEILLQLTDIPVKSNKGGTFTYRTRSINVIWESTFIYKLPLGRAGMSRRDNITTYFKIFNFPNYKDAAKHRNRCG